MPFFLWWFYIKWHISWQKAKKTYRSVECLWWNRVKAEPWSALLPVEPYRQSSHFIGTSWKLLSRAARTHITYRSEIICDMQIHNNNLQYHHIVSIYSYVVCAYDDDEREKISFSSVLSLTYPISTGVSGYIRCEQNKWKGLNLSLFGDFTRLWLFTDNHAHIDIIVFLREREKRKTGEKKRELDWISTIFLWGHSDVAQ